MKIKVDDGVQRYSLPCHKLVSIQQGYGVVPTIVTALIDGKVRTFNSRESFWEISDRIKSVGWKKILNDAGITGGPWSDCEQSWGK